MHQQTLDLRHQIRRCPDCGQLYSPDSVFCPFDGVKLDLAPFDPNGDPLIGQTVDGRYEVTRVLGEGGMGTVYEAKHKALGRAFAMKVLRRDLAEDEELCARFTQEAKATAAIKHPHIVSISDFGTLPDARPYFVMELLTGRTLSSIVKDQGPFDPVRGAPIAAKVALGLAAAHAAGVVHRDLKPENIFVMPGAAEDDVRVVDFGAAMLAGASRLTKAGVVFGTPHYMSPEQATGQKVDHRADVYALGVIMYEMFTGRVPFEDDTYMGVLTQHIYVQPAPPSQFVPERARALGAIEGIILKSLEKQPEDRFQSMQEVADALGEAVHEGADGAPIVAEWRPLEVRPARQASLPPPGPSLEQIRESVAELPPSSRRRGAGWGIVAGLVVVALAVAAAIVVWRRGASRDETPTTTTVTSALLAPSVASATAGTVSGPPSTAASSAVVSAPPVTTARVSVTSPPSPKPSARASASATPTATTTHGEFADPWSAK